MRKQNGVAIVGIVIAIILILMIVGATIKLATDKKYDIKDERIIAETISNVEIHRKEEAKQDIVMAWEAINTEYYTVLLTPKEELFTIENLNKKLETTGVVLTLDYHENGTSKLQYSIFDTNVVYDMQVDIYGNVYIVGETTNSKNDIDLTKNEVTNDIEIK